jgi:hypothetical protein
MTDIPLHERLITFNEAAQLLPHGRRPSASTWWRWSTKGIKGVTLITHVVGGRRYTTPSALRNFIEQLSADSHAPTGSAPSTPTKRTAAIRAAERTLSQEGF